MAKKSFGDGEILKYAWNNLKSNFGVLLGAMVVGFGFALVPILLMAFAESEALVLLLMLIYLLLVSFVTVGIIRITLAIIDGRDARFAMIFSGADRILPFIAVTVLYGLLVMVGLFLFIIPGVIWSLKYMFAPWLVIDQGMPVMAAFEKSKQMTDGLKWDLFGFYYIVSTLALIGMYAFFVGLFITMPFALLAYSKLYRTLGPKIAQA